MSISTFPRLNICFHSFEAWKQEPKFARPNFPSFIQVAASKKIAILTTESHLLNPLQNNVNLSPFLETLPQKFHRFHIRPYIEGKQCRCQLFPVVLRLWWIGPWVVRGIAIRVSHKIHESYLVQEFDLKVVTCKPPILKFSACLLSHWSQSSDTDV